MIQILTLVIFVPNIFRELLQFYVEGYDYFIWKNLSDIVALILIMICQYYYWNSWSSTETGYFIPETDSYFEAFFLPMFLLLYNNLILQHMQTFDATRFFVITVGQTLHEAVPFFLTLGMFIISYTHILLISVRNDD